LFVSEMTMKATTFLAFHSFELAYLCVLAVLPFIASIRIVTVTVLTCLACIAVVALFKKVTRKCVRGCGQTVVITGCDTGEIYRQFIMCSISLNGYVVEDLFILHKAHFSQNIETLTCCSF